MSIDLGCAASVQDPAGYFGRALERGDVQPHASDRGRRWAVLGHQEVSRAFADSDTLSADRVTGLDRLASQRPEGFGLVVELLSGWMIFRDPPAHTRLRVPVRDAFTPRRVGELESTIAQVVSSAFDDLEASASGGVASFTEMVARPVPALVVGALLGVDPERRQRLQAWSDQLATIVFSLSPAATDVTPTIEAAEAFRDLFAPMVDAARDAPDDGLIARIAALESSFSPTELIGMCTMLLFAGHETTTSLLQQMVAVLCEDPALAERLREPEADLGAAVDEFLRVLGPARTMVRKVRVDHERAGASLSAGDTVYLSIAAANHDPRVFDDPATFDPARAPNPHLSFGWGLHHCLGARLAKLEGVLVLRELLTRYPDLRTPGEVPPLHGAVLGFARGPIDLVADRG